MGADRNYSGEPPSGGGKFASQHEMNLRSQTLCYSFVCMRTVAYGPRRTALAALLMSLILCCIFTFWLGNW